MKLDITGHVKVYRVTVLHPSGYREVSHIVANCSTDVYAFLGEGDEKIYSKLETVEELLPALRLERVETI